jgi:2-polyprenyl-3-methyl-5-hydroxy-6-metoxy-1,4-benzoquinol methylase
MINSVSLAKRFMKLREVNPVFDASSVGERREVFSHRMFLDGNANEQREIMRKSSESKENDEHSFPFDNYFGFPLRPHLEGKTVLDLGCFTGGRTVAWHKNYRLRHASGIDVEEVFIQAATNYAQLNRIDCDFKLGFGESIPYESDCFDAVLTFDVLEHVVDVEKTMKEC